MTKHRAKDVRCNDSSADDDFEKPKKKKKTVDSSKDGDKGGPNKDTKSESTKIFRANFGPLHDLFRDLENKGLMAKEELITSLEKTPFRYMLRVFIHNKISKEELSKSNHGLEMLVKTFTKTNDGQYGFRLVEGSDVFLPTPEDMAVDWGLQLIENGIETKLLNERKVTPRTNDLCKRYNFGESSPPVVKSTDVQVAISDAIKNGRVEDFVRLVIFYMCQTIFFTKMGNFSLPCNYLVYVKSLDVINRISWPHLIHNSMMESIESSNGDVRRITGYTFYLLYWFAEHSSLVSRRGGAETMVPRFARWDAWNISKSISVLEKFPCNLTQSDIFKFGHDFTTQLDDAERELINPKKKQSRLEAVQEIAINLEKENVALIIEKDDWINTLRTTHGRFRSEKNRLIAKGKRLKVDVTPEIFQAMATTLEEIFKSLDGSSNDGVQVEENDDLGQVMEATEEEYDIGPDEYERKTPNTESPLPRNETDTVDDGSEFFSLGLTQLFKEAEAKSDLVSQGSENQKKRAEKGVGVDFTPDGLRKRKGVKHVVSNNREQYKQFESLKLYKHMEQDEQDYLKSYFERTNPSLFDNDGGVPLSVLGMHVEDLVDDGYLESELLEYYMYRLDFKQKEAESQIQDSQEPEKYSKSAFMKPGALDLLQSSEESGVDTYIHDFILGIPDGSRTGRFSISTSLITGGSTTTPCQMITLVMHAGILRY
ncbi:hypothetical protein MKX03_024064 [Papaver bracteatum]|nr:hypothetical protein MKX03_024064 [Papaver bracteatum]